MFTAPKFTIPTRILPVESGTELWDFGQNVTDADSPAFGNGELLFFIDGVECYGGCDASGKDFFQNRGMRNVTLFI